MYLQIDQGCSRGFEFGGAQLYFAPDLLEKWRGPPLLLVHNCPKIGGAQAPPRPLGGYILIRNNGAFF